MDSHTSDFTLRILRIYNCYMEEIKSEQTESNIVNIQDAVLHGINKSLKELVKQFKVLNQKVENIELCIGNIADFYEEIEEDPEFDPAS